MGIFLLCLLSHISPSCLSLCLSSPRGSDGCGSCTNEQHDHQSDLGCSRERIGQRTPAGLQGTDSVSPLLFGLTYSAPVLMNNTYVGFTAEADRSQLGKGFRVLFSFKVVKNRVFFILDDLTFKMNHTPAALLLLFLSVGSLMHVPFNTRAIPCILFKVLLENQALMLL